MLRRKCFSQPVLTYFQELPVAYIVVLLSVSALRGVPLDMRPWSGAIILTLSQIHAQHGASQPFNQAFHRTPVTTT